MNPRNAILANEIVKAVMGEAHATAVREAENGQTSETRSLIEGVLLRVENTLNAHNKTAYTDAGFLAELRGQQLGYNALHMVFKTCVDILDTRIRDYISGMVYVDEGYGTAEEAFGVGGLRSGLEGVREAASKAHMAFLVMMYRMGIDADADAHREFASCISMFYQGGGAGAEVVAQEIAERLVIDVDTVERSLGVFCFESARDQQSADGVQFSKGEMLRPHFYRKPDFSI